MTKLNHHLNNINNRLGICPVWSPVPLKVADTQIIVYVINEGKNDLWLNAGQ
jgi:hypothetical protein